MLDGAKPALMVGLVGFAALLFNCPPFAQVDESGADGGGGHVDAIWTAGDCDRDGETNITDAIYLFEFMFLNKENDICFPLCDVDNDGQLTVTDPILILTHAYIDSRLELALPPREEYCDGLDNDCNGEIDETCPAGTRGVSVKLRWDPVTHDMDGDRTEVKKYCVYFGTRPGKYSYAQQIGNVTEWTVGGLARGERYFLAVTAIDDSGNESIFSEEISIRP